MMAPPRVCRGLPGVFVVSFLPSGAHAATTDLVLMQILKSLTRLLPAGVALRPDNWQQLLPYGVSALLAVVLAWQTVQLGWKLLGAEPTIAPAVTGPANTQTRPAATSFDLASIVDGHLFGVASAPGNVDPSDAPATQMSLVLVGTIAQTDPAQGLAIIGESSQSAKVYTVGKVVTGGTKLHSVYPDRVILDRGGKLEALLLPKQFRGGGPSAQIASAGAPVGPDGLGDRIRDMAQRNPAAMTEIMRPQPVFANGQQRGYRVYPGRNRQQFSRLGLMPGDLVTAINGAPLDDPARGLEILQSMNSATDVTVTIERNGQTSQISIDNARVAAEAAAAAVQADMSSASEEAEAEESTE
jgi:general secretion pathway protein C